ncbi:flagellar biosynthesis repressor FlbT [Phyllobacterium endophyticum]|jgi:flagellar biosynthesis repressor protein FlbT|uniref:Probable flagellum biosynthesis repressor protein FlbT n=1 Tax=Phyllobacterium endophyticum TaxID=1149773 RepID=A0A2P7AP23_9HYPH|nr:flagellar biosynthesis repressor FlbT [Phyllobacterium endophyticum]MBB3233701.1 flagellar protein FlbT [Phyllobacterium endophyticum]PSH55953.1 flagellar biosynthesis repressor FlbT [Phyllobacterium endophyticum]TYR41097.1 flagellar biosynthesis repressor FlbT [Phyllobacterium endophyticum]
MKLSLRAGEKVYVNGAVLRVDRKVSIEFMNDVSFLLETHVIQADQTTTPLRQLYFAAQIMLINPAIKEEANRTFKRMLASLLATFDNQQMLKELKLIDEMMCKGRVFDSLKSIRLLYTLEAQILSGTTEPIISSQAEQALRPEASA